MLTVYQCTCVFAGGFGAVCVSPIGSFTVQRSNDLLRQLRRDNWVRNLPMFVRFQEIWSVLCVAGNLTCIRVQARTSLSGDFIRLMDGSLFPVPFPWGRAGEGWQEKPGDVLLIINKGMLVNYSFGKIFLNTNNFTFSPAVLIWGFLQRTKPEKSLKKICSQILFNSFSLFKLKDI